MALFGCREIINIGGGFVARWMQEPCCQIGIWIWNNVDTIIFQCGYILRIVGFYSIIFYFLNISKNLKKLTNFTITFRPQHREHFCCFKLDQICSVALTRLVKTSTKDWVGWLVKWNSSLQWSFSCFLCRFCSTGLLSLFAYPLLSL